jgi:hypothetical protein
MTARNIVTRIERLEARRRGDDEMLLIWRKPGQDTDATVAEFKKAGLFGSGDLVLCAEWYGEGEPSAPRWSRRFPSDLCDVEREYFYRMLRKLVGDNDAIPRMRSPDYSLIHVPTNKLLHMALGVET